MGQYRYLQWVSSSTCLSWLAGINRGARATPWAMQEQEQRRPGPRLKREHSYFILNIFIYIILIYILYFHASKEILVNKIASEIHKKMSSMENLSNVA